MKNEILLDAIGKIDEELVFAAEKSKKKKFPFIKWAAAAAIFAVIIFGAEVKPLEYEVQSEIPAKIEGFENVIYGTILFEERKEFGIIGEDEIGLTEENRYEITEDDIGEFMGTVVEGEEDIIGSGVYHFAKYPDSDRICIIETPEGFKFYTGSIFKQLETDDSSDLIFEIFGFPESLEKMEVQYSLEHTAFEITDEEEIKQIFEILSGKKNIGEEGLERMENGSPEEGCYVVLTAQNGFKLYMNYYSSLNMIWARGYFSLSEAETETLNKIFKLE